VERHGDGRRILTINQICDVTPGAHETLNRIAQLKLAGLIESADARLPGRQRQSR
jgi:hypothetical protein